MNSELQFQGQISIVLSFLVYLWKDLVSKYVEYVGLYIRNPMAHWLESMSLISDYGQTCLWKFTFFLHIEFVKSYTKLENCEELRMLSSVTINCQITKIVMNSGSQLSELYSMYKRSQVFRIIIVKIIKNCKKCQNYKKKMS